MYINELAEAKVLVVFGGRFQPFHQGHAWVYNYLTDKFGRQNVYVGTTGKVEPPKTPFTLSERVYFMNLQGVPSDRIVQISQNYSTEAIQQAFSISNEAQSQYKVLFAVSQKDMETDPRFSRFTKKDGTPSKLQPMPDDLSQVQTMDQHAYILTVPTKEFQVLGQECTSASDIRQLYTPADERTRQQIVADVFGRYTREAEQILTNRLAPESDTTPPAKLPTKAKLQTVQPAKPVDHTDYEYSAESVGESTAKLRASGLTTRRDRFKALRKEDMDEAQILGFLPSPKFVVGKVLYYPNLGQVEIDKRLDNGNYRVWSEQNKGYYAVDARLLSTEPVTEGTIAEIGGVGVVANKKQARDPRYSTSLTKDVRPGQINKSLQAFNLAETDAEQELDNRIKAAIDELERRYGQTLPQTTIDKLEQRYKQTSNQQIKHKSSGRD